MQSVSARLSGQDASVVTEGLIKEGFENVRCVINEGKCYASIENHTYRWDIKAVAEALDIISRAIAEPVEIDLLILENDLPQKLITVKSTEWLEFRSGNAGSLQLPGFITVNNKITDAWTELKKSDRLNSSTRKLDIVVYPQIYFENTLVDKFYETQFNIAPAFEYSPWKGGRITAQIIFPIQNSLGYEGDHIRPGIISITQNFRFSDNLRSNLSAGNFPGSIYGITASSGLYLLDGDMNLELMAGLVGSSHLIDNEWVHSQMERFTASASLSWFWPHFNMELKAGMARFVNEDFGLFASALRMFNETSVGLYAQILESGTNGGFFFSVPLFFSRRSTRKLLRITIPPQYGFTYNAGTEYSYGQFLRTESNSIYKDRFKWNKSIENMIINLKNKKE